MLKSSKEMESKFQAQKTAFDELRALAVEVRAVVVPQLLNALQHFNTNNGNGGSNSNRPADDDQQMPPHSEQQQQQRVQIA